MEMIPENYMCTMNRKIVSLEAAKADGNRAYDRRGGSKRCYFFNGVTCQEAHCDDNKNFYLNNRPKESNKWEKEFVDKESIFYIKRQYRYNKENSFNQMIVEVYLFDQHPLDYYYILYRKNKSQHSDTSDPIILTRHGNAKNPHTGNNL